MATRYSQDQQPSGSANRGAQSARRPASSSARTGSRSQSTSRSYQGSRQSTGRSYQGSRQQPARGGSYNRSRSSGQRRSTGSRGNNRSSLPLIAALLVVVIAVAIIIIRPFGHSDKPVQPASVPVVAQTDAQQAADAQAADSQAQSIPYNNIAQALADADADVGSLSAADMAQVTDLSVNTGLPSEWMNVLLLGTDERVLSDSARTDSMIICSINTNTGEVKLASIMRDLAIDFNDIGKWSNTYRINAANFFGGPRLAMKTVNEKFGMNIQYYVMVNFFGFQRIAERLGGIDIDITEEEMNKINAGAYSSYKIANSSGIDISDVTYEKLTTYGENTHLNGTQALAYARIRKLSGGDAMRTERQRTVLTKLLEKVKRLSPIEMASLGGELMGQVKTNMEFNDIFRIATLVCGNGISSVESTHLPINGSYKEETRNEQSMLYDCDFTANAQFLYNFIYD